MDTSKSKIKITTKAVGFFDIFTARYIDMSINPIKPKRNARVNRSQNLLSFFMLSLVTISFSKITTSCFTAQLKTLELFCN